MTYTLQEQYTSKNQVPGSSADSVWHLGARKVSSITIHHWGLKGQQFDTVRDFLCTNNTPTSAHYVAQDGLVACIVSPDDCAFHAGNAEGNSHSIGIECRPEATDGDYATIAELIAYLRGIYGDIPLYPHNHWYNTACPGDYDLARLDSLARGGTISVQSATITPASSTEEDDMPYSEADLTRIIAAAVDPAHQVTRGNIIDTLTKNTEAQHEETRKQVINMTQAQQDVTRGYLADRVKDASPEDLIAAIPDNIAQQVIDGLGARLAGK